ncbi:MAG: exodeoxyribonuclease V subunit gamma [Rhodococcus sp. (in: high G+C Gram-positive bacteria)]
MLELHRAERASTLAAALADLLSAPLSDAFAAEVVCVPARGVERWLQQRLSLSLGAAAGSDGIAANIVFPSPSQLVDDAMAAFASDADSADQDGWAAGPLLWTTLRVIDRSMDEPWCAVLANSIGGSGAALDDHRRGRRWSTAAHVSGLFRSYVTQRPTMIADWAAGRNTDGAGADLSTDLLWQAELWRRVREVVGVPSPAERLDEVCELIVDRGEALDLPARLSLFGATRLTALQRRVLHAISRHRDVHLWLPHPSPQLWTSRDGATMSGSPRRRSDASAPPASGHPLLTGLARDVRELQPLLEPLADADHHHRDTERDSATTVLRRLQNDIAANRLSEPPVAPGMDRSVGIHACHGPARQVDVLRDTLLHLFQDDPTLEPRDVLVMCPDVDTFAPLIRAAFGNAPSADSSGTVDTAQHPAHGLRVRLADRGLRRTNSVLDVVASVIDMAGGRVTASHVLDLAAAEAVRTRFRFAEDDLERLREWTRVSGARWGIDSLQRRPYGLGDFRQNTFTAALDRLLLGVTADETTGEWLGLALPVDDVDGNDIDLVGRYAELVDRVSVVLHSLTGEHGADEWRERLHRIVDLLTDVRPADTWQHVDAMRELASAFERGDDVPLTIADVRSVLRDRLAGRPTRSNFRTGELTVCTMVPMRSVPHRVVVLLGLDDEVFPRAGHLDGDDVLSRDPLIGERDVRSEDRQLLLDAVMSAGETLLLFHTGADPVSGAAVPPAIPLAEVIDVVRTTAGVDPVTPHPLQPFDPTLFDASAPFGFDTAALGGALAAARPSVPQDGFLDGILAAAPLGDVDLNALVAFVQNPVAAFLRQRLTLRLSDIDDDPPDAMSVDSDPLSTWNIGDRMLTALLTGVDVADFRAAEWRRGTLPPFEQGVRLLDGITSDVVPIATVAGDVHVGPPRSVDVVVELGDGRRLTGTVPGVHGTTIARTSFSRMAGKRRLEAWVHLLAVAASGTGGEWTAVTTGRGTSSRPVSRSTLQAPDDALRILSDLVNLRDRGLREPLPAALKAGEKYADLAFRGVNEQNALAKAGAEFSGRFGDVHDAAIVLVHGDGAPFEVLIDAIPATDEALWSPDSTRFGVVAQRLWSALLAHETMEHL